jgi:RNA polymerase sigma-70 factor, ECF subfamily
MAPIGRTEHEDVDGVASRLPGPEAFDAFFAREYAAVVGLAAVLTGDRVEAEDLAQDAFAAAHREWSRVGAYDDPGGWVRRVVSNRAASVLRRRLREAGAFTRLGRRRATPPEDADVERDEFWTAVRSLSRRQAECVALFYLEDRSIADIAALLGLAESTVRVHLHQGRRELGRRLDMHDEEEQ